LDGGAEEIQVTHGEMGKCMLTKGFWGARDYQYKALELSTYIKVGLEASKTGGGVIYVVSCLRRNTSQINLFSGVMQPKAHSSGSGCKLFGGN
jgi:hypothetical protein